MRLSTLDYILWCADPFLTVAIASSVYRRRLYRSFPLFFAYLLFQLLAFAVELPLHDWKFYFYVYWTETVLSMLLASAVLVEVFREALRLYPALRDLSMLLLRWSALTVLLLTWVWAIASWQEPNQIDRITNGISISARAVRIMQCGLVCFMLLFSRYLRISKRHVGFGITIGFGFYAAVNLLVMSALFRHTGFDKMTLSRVNSVSYLVSALVWLAYTLLPAEKRRSVTTIAASSQEWNSDLTNDHGVASREGLFVTLEETIERLLAPPRK